MRPTCEGLIISVGKTWEPIVYTLREFVPRFAAFLCTPDSCQTLDQILAEYPLRPSCHQVLQVPDDPQAIGQMVTRFYSAYRWLREEKGLHPSHIIVDPTPGRKWMSSAVTMMASYLGANMAYVDVSYKEGKPDPSTMKMVNLGNAYDQTGFLEIERGIQFFNAGAWENARETFGRIQSHDSSLSDLADGLARLSEVMKRWDLFIHYRDDLSPDFGGVLKNLRRTAFSDPSHRAALQTLISDVERLQKFATRLYSEPPPNLLMTVDLFLNAERCIQKGRYDDGVARLYRVLESVAQYYLKMNYGVDTSKPDFSKIDPSVVEKLGGFKGGKLPEKLGLEDDYVLLHLARHPVLADEVIKGFKEDGRPINVFHELLEKRNNSILAHGFKPVDKSLAEKLFGKTEGLLDKVLKEIFREMRNDLRLPRILSMFVQ